MPRSIIMFCGQGAQYFQMGRELYQHNRVFRQSMDCCDAISGDLLGKSSSGIIFGLPASASERFDDLAESNAALLSIGYSLAVTLLDAGLRPDRLLGYSLGETIAAVFGGVLSLEDGFRLVLGQARLFAQLAPDGAMVAVLSGSANISAIPEVSAFCDIAAINTPKHSVLSLLARDFPALRAALDDRGLVWAKLPIRFPFHAAALDPLAGPMQRLAGTFRFAASRWPIISAATARIVPYFDAIHLWRVARERLKFEETIAALAREDEWMLVEAGPSGTLASFTKQIGAPGIKACPVIDQFGHNLITLNQALAAFA